MWILTPRLLKPTKTFCSTHKHRGDCSFSVRPKEPTLYNELWNELAYARPKLDARIALAGTRGFASSKRRGGELPVWSSRPPFGYRVTRAFAAGMFFEAPRIEAFPTCHESAG